MKKIYGRIFHNVLDNKNKKSIIEYRKALALYSLAQAQVLKQHSAREKRKRVMKKTENNATINSMKASEIKRILRECAELQDTLATDFNDKYCMCDDEHKKILNELLASIQDEKHIVELRDTTNCIMFVRDEHNNVLFNVYDTFRLQFTTQQAKKYSSELLKDSRFYTFTYKQKEFISAKSKDINDFIDLCKYCYKAIDASEKATTTATKQEQKAKKNA